MDNAQGCRAEAYACCPSDRIIPLSAPVVSTGAPLAEAGGEDCRIRLVLTETGAFYGRLHAIELRSNGRWSRAVNGFRLPSASGPPEDPGPG